MTSKFQLGYSVLVLTAMLALVYGWFVNLFALIEGCVDFTVASNWALLLLRGLGVFVAPMGGILGLVV